MTINLQDNIQRVLVTGGSGFIGGCLIRHLLLDSHIQVYNLDKCGYASDHTSISKTLPLLGSQSRYQLLETDLVNERTTSEAVAYAQPDLIFHLAAESHVDRSIDSPSSFIQSNILGTFNLLQAVRLYWEQLSLERQHLFRFHHISTDEVYGSLGPTDSFSESSKYNPRSPYSASKASSDHLVNAWHHTYGIPTLITNCSNNFGPWQFPEKLIPLVILKALSLESIPIYGDGSNIRDWLFVDDHVEALLLVASTANPGSNYCIGGHGERTNLQVVTSICGILDKLAPKHQPYETLIKLVQDRPGHDQRYAINSTLINSELGWAPQYSFEQALETTVRWYLTNLEWCNALFLRNGYSGERIGTNITLND